MLLLSRGDEILMERRPPAGIWGGLWCLPELDSKQTPRRYCESMGFEAGPFRSLETVQHGFTHFDLTIKPLYATIRLVIPAKAGTRLRKDRLSTSLRWHRLADFSGGSAPGVPAPVRKLLHQVMEQQR
jgi:A/G-specific adenine glycosylase